MTPTFDDPELAAIARYLTGSATVPAAGERPSPAHMPRRIQRPQTAADIERAENLDLGIALRRPRTAQRPTRRRPSGGSALKAILDHIEAAGCQREEAHRLARQWLTVESSLTGVRCWADKIGVRLPHTAKELLNHGLSPADLDTLIGGTSAHRRLRNGESVGQIIAALLAARHQSA